MNNYNAFLCGAKEYLVKSAKPISPTTLNAVAKKAGKSYSGIKRALALAGLGATVGTAGYAGMHYEGLNREAIDAAKIQRLSDIAGGAGGVLGAGALGLGAYGLYNLLNKNEEDENERRY